MMFYKSKKWRGKRQRILRRDDFLCRESARYGVTVSADTVHHIFPLDKFPELALVDWNLLSVSSTKHNTFHDRQTNEIIGQGKYWQKKFRKEFEKFYGYPPPL